MILHQRLSTETNSTEKQKGYQHDPIYSLKHTPQIRLKIKTRNKITQSPPLQYNRTQSITNSTMALTANCFKQSIKSTYRKNNSNNTNRQLHLSQKLNIKAKPESNEKIRKVKLKIHKIIQANPLNQCLSFNSKNDELNIKILDHIKSDYYIKRQLTYHDTFHFDKNELGESHNRYAMIMKYKAFNFQSLNPIEQIGLMLSEEEKKMIMLDPDYFFNENLNLLTYDLFKSNSLTETFENEDNPKQKAIFNLNNKKNNLFASTYRNYEPNYTFNVPRAYMEDEINEKQKDIEGNSKRILNKYRDDKLAQLGKNKMKMNLKGIINKDITKMIRKINANTNKSIKPKSLYKKKNKDEEDNEEASEIAFKESRNKLLMKNFIRLRNEDRDSNKRKLKRNTYGNNPLGLRYYLSEITKGYIKPIITAKNKIN